VIRRLAVVVAITAAFVLSGAPGASALRPDPPGDGESAPTRAMVMPASAYDVDHADHHRGLAALRRATNRFHSLSSAQHAGYGFFTDAKGIACIDMPGEGGMGVHFVKGALVADPTLDIRHPEALVYAPDRDGTLRLAALEFIVDKAAWDAHHAQRPALFRNAPFDLTTAPNRFGLAPFYSQHVWLFRPNPAGTLAMWNPKVVCP
jgi:hypothetical protein